MTSAEHDTENILASAVLDALPDATAVLDQDGTIIAVNRVWDMFALDNGGQAESTGVGVNYLDVCDRAARSGCADAGVVGAGLRAVLQETTAESTHDYPCPSPTAHRWFISRVTPIAKHNGGALASHVNITRRKLAEEELEHRAAHDPLTGLANRRLFDRRMAAALGAEPTATPPKATGVLFVDLDGFKAINDTYGHDAGDELLLMTTTRLHALVRSEDTVARLGGDEFAICVPNITSADLQALARRIATALAVPHRIHGQQVRVCGSVGTHLAAPGETVDDAVQHADRAMYAKKRSRAAVALPPR